MPRCRPSATKPIQLTHSASRIYAHGLVPSGAYQDRSLLSEKLLLTHWRNLNRKFLDLENTIQQSLKVSGIKLSGAARGAFDQAVRAAMAEHSRTQELMDPAPTARAAL